jgi:(1->4)-alpha-D-glucan 1-alpha-D-glucosylmutase
MTARSATARPPPRATYRLQFHRGFTLRDALAWVPGLHMLGVSHLYASPLLKARAGSTHGYDVCDYSRLNPELGTEADLEALVAALREHGMGLVLDLVPNHMGLGPENPWWWDVLQHGPASRFAGYFDLDWNPPDPRLRDKVLLPVLGDEYDRVLARGELRVVCEGNDVIVRYSDHRFPVAPESLLVPGKFLAEAVAEFNADAASLDCFLERQHYRLAWWRHGDARLNYRRFFTITDLAGVCVENPQVFSDTHNCVLGWHQRGWLDGFRVDHIDGLRDPAQYLQRLSRAAPGAWLVVEKILEPAEALPRAWPVAGTTGYDFLNRLGGLFVDPAGEPPLTEFYAAFTGEPTDYPALVREKKRLILREYLVAEVDRLTRLWQAAAARHGRDFAPETLRAALIEAAACFPVYRTYARTKPRQISRTDRDHIQTALAAAREQQPDLDPAIFDFLGALLRLELKGDAADDFVARFQQLTGPAMAKGVEDTAFYCYGRFVALNEVGGDPARFGLSVADFHRACRQAQAEWPAAMLATSTHDTKRSEDVRARLYLLSEMPGDWSKTVRRWSATNERRRRGGYPDRNLEYRIYQMLVGTWPLSQDRALGYLVKAAREAKQHTSWTQPNLAYEQALKDFAVGAVTDATFVADLERFVAPLVEPGYVNSLAQTLIKLTAPGVPDIYRGTELWDFSLVDPDNRRPVDFALRLRLLEAARGLSAEEAWARRGEGVPKLWLIQRALALRAQRPELFDAGGGYEPLEAAGARAAHVVAFCRGGEVATVAPRLVWQLGDDWADTTLALPLGLWLNELTGDVVRGGRVPLRDLLRRFPVALLSRTHD